MQYFSTREWYDLKDRGPVAVIEKPPRSLPDPRVLVGQKVKINLKKYVVKGVETFAIPITEQMPYNHSFGLLVEAVPLPPCLPNKKRYKTIGTCHRMLLYLEKTTSRKMDMYECGDHWHIVRAQDD